MPVAHNRAGTAGFLFLSGPELQMDGLGWFWVQAGVGFETNGFPQSNELRKAVFVKEAPTSGETHTA